MAYAQINYPQRLGDGVYTIADAGCFLTAFANLLERFGEPIDPPTLNNYFMQHGAYLPAPDEGNNVRDNLAWGSVTSYDTKITTTALGGAGWPSGNYSIVKFIYISKRTGQTVPHFCMVADAMAHTIVDSWDGVTKPSPYGEPVASATYERHAPQPNPAPAPVSQPAYSIENIPEKTLQLTKDTHLWDLTQRTWPGMVNNPVNSSSVNYEFKSSALAHHVLGGSYYMPDSSQPHGYNTADCTEVVPPAPQPQPQPTPVPVPRPAPSAPLTATSNDPYNVVVTLDGYYTSNQAANRVQGNSKVQPGTYLIFNKRYDASQKLIAINVTQKANQPGWWINPADNVFPEKPATVSNWTSPREVSANAVTPGTNVTVAPAPAPTMTTVADVVKPDWRTSYHAYAVGNNVRVPRKFQLVADYTMKDLAGQKRDLPIFAGQWSWISGTFTGPDGVLYGRPKDAADRCQWYGIPLHPDIHGQRIIVPYDELHPNVIIDKLIILGETIANIFKK